MTNDDQDKKINNDSNVDGAEFLDTTEAEIEKELAEEKPEEPLEIPKHETVAGIEFDEFSELPKIEEKMETVEPKPEQPIQRKIGNSQIPMHTFSEDIAKAVKTGGGKILREALTETDDRTKQIQMKGNRQLIFSLATIFLFIAGIIIILYFIQPQEAPIYIETPNTAVRALISSENTHQIDVTDKGKLNVVNEIVATYEKETNINTVANIYFVEQSPLGKSQLTINDFLALLRTTTPVQLLASLDPKFMFGTYVGETTTPFLIIKSNSLTDLSSGLRSWESALLNDMYQLFQIKRGGIYNVFEKSFEDVVVANKDGRAVYDADRNPVFMYVFINDTTVVFTTNTTTATEVIRRYISPIL